MMIRTIQAKNNCQGFTLVELMIVVAIIGVLAAIAIPQFSAYRTRSFNANAKALNEMGIVVQADLNAELGCYGHSEAVAATLAAGAGVAAPAVSSTVPALAIGATAAVGGGRLNGTNIVTGKIFSVPLGVGNRMTLDSSESAVGAAGACPSGGCSNVIYTRADQGDTAYGSDSDMTGTLFSVSNPAWVAAAAGLVATPLAATDNVNDIEGIAAGGAPTVTWEQVQ